MSFTDFPGAPTTGPCDPSAEADAPPPLSLLGPAQDCQRLLADLRIRATRAPPAGSTSHARHVRLAASCREQAEAQYRKLFEQPIAAIKADLPEATRRYNLILRAVAKLEQALAASARRG